MSTQIIEQPELQTPQKERREMARGLILEALRLGKSLAASADHAGVARVTLLRWRTEDEEFAAACADAIETGTDQLEDEAQRRAMGWKEDVYYEGEVVGQKFVASDRLMEFTLSGRRPDKFRAKATTVNVDARTQTINALAPEAMEILQRLANASGGNYDRGKGDGEKS